ncbi:MAG TPA: DUF3089 domain-containing protein [Caulobacteraceae bacterium]|jgi:hypothetical protein|nr:DUF3089 domain-containing protein [Caulobacteraceae bacterium]
MRNLAVLIATAVLALAGGAAAQTPPAPLPANDYANKADWLCWPGASPNACDVDLTTTVVEPDGATRIEPFKADANAPIDCFYVYPTVSTDPGVLATMAIEPAETRVVTQQFARFGAACRLYAPVYRQFTLTAMVAAMSGHPLADPKSRPVTPYEDVHDAWNYYLAHANHGRGVVLIGHSQGSGLLTALIKREIDGKPVQKQLVLAILMGTRLAVPAGKDVGGDFQSIPLCHRAGETGCAIAYASFRDTAPPPPNSLFGRPEGSEPAGLVAACVNPANLEGGPGELHAYLASGAGNIVTATEPPPAWAGAKPITTPFVSLPGMLSARCAASGPFNYLAIHVTPSPGGARASDINGDVVYGGQMQPDWGLHLIDANLAIGNLVSLVAEDGHAWLASHR